MFFERPFTRSEIGWKNLARSMCACSRTYGMKGGLWRTSSPLSTSAVYSRRRSEDGADDGAVPVVALVKALSSVQLRLHFIIYWLVASHPFNRDIAESRAFWEGLQLLVPADELLKSLDVTRDDWPANLLLAVIGLVEAQLIEKDFAIQIGTLRQGDCSNLKDDAFAVKPNRRGASLFLRALGLRGLHPELITAINVETSLSEDVKAAIRLPRSATCTHRFEKDPFDLLRDDLEGKLDDFDRALDEVRDTVDGLKRDADEKDLDGS